MATSLKSLFRLALVVLSWVPFLVFFSVISIMFLTDFQNPVDKYFVHLILRGCLILIIATTCTQMATLSILGAWSVCPSRRKFLIFNDFNNFLNAFPIVDIGIYSIAIFFTAPLFADWVIILTCFMLVPTLSYWTLFLKGPARNLFVFGHMHKVGWRKIHHVLSPFYIKSFLDYYFTTLKQFLMPLVFVLVVMDFRIILPRLVEKGLSYQAFALFLSLIISLHLLSYKQEAQS